MVPSRQDVIILILFSVRNYTVYCKTVLIFCDPTYSGCILSLLLLSLSDLVGCSARPFRYFRALVTSAFPRLYFFAILQAFRPKPDTLFVRYFIREVVNLLVW